LSISQECSTDGIQTAIPNMIDSLQNICNLFIGTGNAEEGEEILFYNHETVPWVQLSAISFCMAQTTLAQSDSTILELKCFPVADRT